MDFQKAYQICVGFGSRWVVGEEQLLKMEPEDDDDCSRLSEEARAAAGSGVVPVKSITDPNPRDVMSSNTSYS